MKRVLNKKLAQTIEQAEIDTLQSRLLAIRGIGLNPMGVEVKKFGHATAFSVQHIPGPSFNTVKGITDEDVNQIDKMVDFIYKDGSPSKLK